MTKCVLLYHKNTAISHRLCDHKTHCAFSLSVNIVTNNAQRRQRQTLRRCDLERALGGDTWCVKKTVSVLESSVATFSVLYRTNAVLLKFNNLALFYVNHILFFSVRQIEATTPSFTQSFYSDYSSVFIIYYCPN